jgi:8-oxo-dGTP diphosphatase
VYSDPNRDPRGHIISICFFGHKIGGKMVSDTDAEDVKYFGVDEISNIELAFDHHIILDDAFRILNIGD